MQANHFKPTILVTGATGFLGGAFAAELLSDPVWPSVLLLVRADDSSHAFQRVVRSLKRFVTDGELIGRLRPEQVLAGDFTQPAGFVADARLKGVKRVVHCAALTSFGASNRVFSTNVDGTLKFIHELWQVASIERYLHVSTAMICGDKPARLVGEDDYPCTKVNHLVNYTKSKAEAERLLRQSIPGFPLVVVRPTIIVGHTRFGCLPSGSIYWTFRMVEALRMITCGPEARIDVVPVDYAAQSLKHLLFKPELFHLTYHIAAGESSSCTWREIASAFAATRLPVGSRSESDKQTEREAMVYKKVRFEEIAVRKPEFDRIFGPCNKKFMLAAAGLYAGFAKLDTVFDSTRLQNEGMPPSPRFVDYLALCEKTSAAQTIAEQGMVDFA